MKGSDFLESSKCENCRDLILRNEFYSPRDWLNCLEYLKTLLERGTYELTEQTCDFDAVRGEDGKWSADLFRWVLRCRTCGQTYICYANTYRGCGGFRRERSGPGE